MKRLLVLGAVVLMSGAVLLAKDTDEHVLLTPSGVLYSVVSEDSAAGRALKLYVQRGDDIQSVTVPHTSAAGYHVEPALAYEPESDTLFVFWEHFRTRMSSELLFCTYKNGLWGEPSSIDSAVFRDRFHLQIGVTRFVDDEQSDGSIVRKPGTVIHAVWWEQTGYGEVARYAMLSVENGKITLIDIRDALNFVTDPPSVSPTTDTSANSDLFRHPAIFASPERDSVDLLFADWNSRVFHRVEIRPRRGQGRLRPPIGRSRGRISGPRMLSTDLGRVTILPGRPGSDSLIFYFESEKRLNYLLYSGGKWSDLQSIVLNDTVRREVGVNVMRKLLASE